MSKLRKWTSFVLCVLLVGALLVGRIENHCEAPKSFEKLEEKGFFSYGGSTVILLMQRDAVRIDEDILHYSAQGIETRVKLGERIGKRP